MEIWDAYFHDGTLAGCDLVRGEAIPEGLYHLVSEILVRHEDGEYLMMQRSLQKPNHPGAWEATAGGSALKGEDALTCAMRETAEETGIRQGHFTPIGHCTMGHAIYYQFLCNTAQEKDSILCQPGETEAYRWVSEESFIRFIHSGDMILQQKERYRAYFQQMGYIKA